MIRRQILGEDGDLLRVSGKEEAKAKCHGNSRFLHCAAHDETVSSFGRNDDFKVRGKQRRQQQHARQALADAWTG
jgi:hypothetical protein